MRCRQTIAALERHVFNNIIWPDFTRLPDAARPLLQFVPFGVGEILRLGGRTIEVLPARHTVPAVGFAVNGAQGHWVFTGDTGPNPALWQRLAELAVRHLVIETAFGDDEIEPGPHQRPPVPDPAAARARAARADNRSPRDPHQAERTNRGLPRTGAPVGGTAPVAAADRTADVVRLSRDDPT